MEKEALLRESNRFSDAIRRDTIKVPGNDDLEKAEIDEENEKYILDRLEHIKNTVEVEPENIPAHAAEGDLVKNFKEWWNDGKEEAKKKKKDSEANDDENATAQTGLLAEKDD